jgi:hypothetical protein
VCVCMYVCVCMCVCMCMWLCVCIHVCMHVCMYVGVCTCLWSCDGSRLSKHNTTPLSTQGEEVPDERAVRLPIKQGRKVMAVPARDLPAGASDDDDEDGPLSNKARKRKRQQQRLEDEETRRQANAAAGKNTRKGPVAAATDGDAGDEEEELVLMSDDDEGDEDIRSRVSTAAAFVNLEKRSEGGFLVSFFRLSLLFNPSLSCSFSVLPTTNRPLLHTRHIFSKIQKTMSASCANFASFATARFFVVVVRLVFSSFPPVGLHRRGAGCQRGSGREQVGHRLAGDGT